MQELPDAPTLEVKIGRPELLRHNRWNAGYFEERFRQNEKKRSQRVNSLSIIHSQTCTLLNFTHEERTIGYSYAAC
jgi:hypothetical protein